LIDENREQDAEDAATLIWCCARREVVAVVEKRRNRATSESAGSHQPPFVGTYFVDTTYVDAWKIAFSTLAAHAIKHCPLPYVSEKGAIRNCELASPPRQR